MFRKYFFSLNKHNKITFPLPNIFYNLVPTFKLYFVLKPQSGYHQCFQLLDTLFGYFVRGVGGGEGGGDEGGDIGAFIWVPSKKILQREQHFLNFFRSHSFFPASCDF